MSNDIKELKSKSQNLANKLNDLSKCDGDQKKMNKVANEVKKLQKEMEKSYNSMKPYLEKIHFDKQLYNDTTNDIKRALNQPEKAHLLNRQLLEGSFQVEYPDQETMRLAGKIFEKTVSKKNTLFDAIVAATAKRLGTNYIFSFDRWYSKEGFKLTEVPAASFKKIN